MTNGQKKAFKLALDQLSLDQKISILAQTYDTIVTTMIDNKYVMTIVTQEALNLKKCTVSGVQLGNLIDNLFLDKQEWTIQNK